MKALIVVHRKTPFAEAKANIEALGLAVLKEYAKLDNTFLVEGDKAVMEQVTNVIAIESTETKLSLQMADVLAPWHLRRLVTKSLPVRKEYDPLYTGVDVVVYVVDSGINNGHPEFAGKAVEHLFSVSGNFLDHTGHGTAMAAYVNGNVLGVAKDAIVKSVKITDDNHVTLMTDLLDALDAILLDHDGSTIKVVNMSWTVPKSALLDLKVTELRDKNIVVVCAAGNTGEPVNLYSPAGLNTILTVGAADEYDRVVDFSGKASDLGDELGVVNYGAEVDLCAPGVDVPVTKPDGTYGVASGTSVSSAIVAGAAALFVEKNRGTAETAQDVMSEIVAMAMQKMLFRDGALYATTPNRIAYVDNKYYREVWLTPAGQLAVFKKTAGNVEVELAYEADVVSITSPDFASLPPFMVIEGNKIKFNTNDVPHAAPVGYQFILDAKTASGQEYSRGFSIAFYENDPSEVTSESEEYFFEEGVGDYTANVRYATQTFKF